MEEVLAMSAKRISRRFAVCLDNAGYPASLERYKIYRVLPDAQAARDDYVRVIDESGEDYLYPATMFAFVELPPKVRRAMVEAS
jgi:hypothetical protein